MIFHKNSLVFMKFFQSEMAQKDENKPFSAAKCILNFVKMVQIRHLMCHFHNSSGVSHELHELVDRS